MTEKPITPERFEPTELARTMNAPKSPRPDQDRINAVHVMLAEQGGEWKPGCGWHYINDSMTRWCLEALVSDGYVSKGGQSYGLGGHGFERAEELGYDPSAFDDEQS